MLTAKNISHAFRHNASDIPALKNIDLHIPDQKFVSLIGPSGCGKTTLLNIIAGYIQPTEGHIAMHDKKVSRPGRDRIVINQENDLFDWMTVAENIRFGFSDTTHGADDLISLVNLRGFDATYPACLSGGMKKRASLARALATNPRVLLMDEPFGSLDYQTKEKLQIELLKLWAATNKTIVLVTHDIEEAVFLSDTIIVLSKRPATVKKTVSVPFAHPRMLGLKSDPEFIRIKNEIRDALA